MDNPANLNEYPRVEFWIDTKREPYKEDIQQAIRSHLTKYGQDLREKLAITIDLDEGNKEWMYTTFFFPKDGSARRYHGSLEEENDR